MRVLVILIAALVAGCAGPAQASSPSTQGRVHSERFDLYSTTCYWLDEGGDFTNLAEPGSFACVHDVSGYHEGKQ